MKRLLLAILSFILIAPSAHAMGGQVPKPVSCLEKATKAICEPKFGNPFQPNFSCRIPIYSLDANGRQTVSFALDEHGVCYPNAFYNASKPQYDPNGYAACQSSLFAQCGL